MSLCEALLFCYWCLQQQYVDISAVLFVDGKFIVLCVLTPLFYSLEYIHFLLWTLIVRLYDFEIVHDISSVADGTIMYDASSTPTIWSMVLCCALYQGQLVLPVLQYLPVSCERDGLWARDLDNCKSSSGEAVSIGTLCGQICTVNLLYIWAMLLTGQVFQ